MERLHFWRVSNLPNTIHIINIEFRIFILF